MQDKLIEAVAKVIAKRMGRVSWQAMSVADKNSYYSAAHDAIATVRAHDAGTDEEVISYRARQIWRRFVGIPITEPYTAEFQWLLDLLSGNEAPKKTLTEAVQEARGNLEPPTVPIRFASPASHAAESAPQLDAEDPAEPVEDAVERIVCHACGMAMVFRRVDTKTLETFHTCAEARSKGYVKLEDVEKAIREMWTYVKNGSCLSVDSFVNAFRASLDPKLEPTLAEVRSILAKRGLIEYFQLAAELAALVDRRSK